MALDMRVDPPWIKLLIRDTSGGYLLVKWSAQWEVPGTELPPEVGTNGEACTRFLEEFAQTLGVTIQAPQLAAEVLQYFARRDIPTPFRWYKASLIEGVGSLAVDEQDITELAWMPLSEALVAIPYPSGRRILQQIAQWPDAVIRGEYEVDYSVNPPGGSLRIIRDFSPE
jgi:hypothetical protein